MSSTLLMSQNEKIKQPHTNPKNNDDDNRMYSKYDKRLYVVQKSKTVRRRTSVHE